jgi:asparagine synthase (glutamine-hydrolysing)
MCGWVGVFGTPEHEAVLRKAGDTLASRGPDDAGERVVDHGPLRAGLAHRRLAILDPTPAGAQPMFDATRHVSITYNGEIYNSPQLRQELEARGARFRSGTDTEVILVGWAEWGDQVLDRLQGIFSFALVDERRGRVLLARDRLGVKPLYWAQVDDAVVAGSAPRAILALRPNLRHQLDHVALAQFLTLLWIPHPRTPWASIRKLPPGCAVVIEGGRARQRRYWHPPGVEGGAVEPEQLRERLASATAAQLLSDVPVGLLFSGGLDSSVLLAFMARYYTRSDIQALTAGYDPVSQRLEMAPDDVAYARRVAEATPAVRLSEVEIGDDAGSDLDELGFHFDDPVADPAAITLYRLAQASPTKVLLSGVGGEELFAGYPRHLALPLARRAAGAPPAVRRLLAACSPMLKGGRPGPGYAGRRNAQKLARAVGGRAEPHYWRMMAQLTRSELRSLMGDTAAEAWDELDGASALLSSASLGQALDFDRAQFLPNLNLAYVDKAAMAAGVEVRVPLLDEDVFSLAAAADPATFTVDGTSKVPLRQAATGLVAQEVIDRPKSGFGGPARGWFRGKSRAGLRERIEAAADTGLVDRSAARKIFHDAATGRQDAALAGWALACLHVWYREHAAGPR